MKDIKKGDPVRVKDPDGGDTAAKVTKVIDERTCEVRWLAPRWNLNTGSLMARKGTKSVISRESIV